MVIPPLFFLHLYGEVSHSKKKSAYSRAADSAPLPIGFFCVAHYSVLHSLLHIIPQVLGIGITCGRLIRLSFPALLVFIGLLFIFLMVFCIHVYVQQLPPEPRVLYSLCFVVPPDLGRVHF